MIKSFSSRDVLTFSCPDVFALHLHHLTKCTNKMVSFLSIYELYFTAEAKRKAAAEAAAAKKEEQKRLAEEKKAAAAAAAEAKRAAAAQKKAATEAKKSVEKAAPGATINLFGGFGGGGADAAKSAPAPAPAPKARSKTLSLFGGPGEKTSPPPAPAKKAAAAKPKPKPKAKPAPKKAPAGVPSLVNWKQNRDGGITGFISGSPAFDEGERVTTSPITAGDVGAGNTVQTGSGSRYFLV